MIRLILAFGYLFLALSAQGYAQSSSPVNSAETTNSGAVGYAVRIMGDENSTRMLMDFDSTISTNIQYMDQPRRIVIDLPKTVFRFAGGKNAFEPRGLVSLVRHGAISKQTTRIVITLKNAAKVTSQEITPIKSGNGYRVILDIDAISSQDFANLIEEQDKTHGASGAIAKKGDRVFNRNIANSGSGNGLFKIVIDPGHGGIDGGAVGVGGTKEKEITFAVASKIKAQLEKIGPFDVLLTHDEDVFVSLRQRVDFTRTARADLFISIHADSLSQRYVRGSTVYTLSKKASDKLSAKLAESENLTDLVAGLALPEEEENAVTDILVELTARETIRFSRHFSGVLTSTLKNGIKLIKNPQRNAAFGVLKAPEVPSVLLELGYLSNKEDEKLMSSKLWQAKLARLVSEAVLKFFKPRLP